MTCTTCHGSDGIQSPTLTLAESVLQVLRELVGVLKALPQEAYSQPGGAEFAHACIGGHVRHTLDHLRALGDGALTGLVEYDTRDRGTRIECDRDAAIAEVERLMGVYGPMRVIMQEQPLRLAIMPARDGRCVEVHSTLSRELAFVLSHTIHHNATVRSMATSRGIALPASFGYAPATLAYLDSDACAR